MSGYVYITSEPGLLTVGFYDPKGKWHADSDYTDREEAAARVRYLNGGNLEPVLWGHGAGAVKPEEGR